MTERVCPVTKAGLHLKRPWQDREGRQSGMACRACHRTWTWRGRDLVPTWPDEGAQQTQKEPDQ